MPTSLQKLIDEQKFSGNASTQAAEEANVQPVRFDEASGVGAPSSNSGIIELSQPFSESTLVGTAGEEALQEAPSQITLAELENIALANNPALVAAHATISKASGLRYQVGRRANPTFGYSGNQLADVRTDQHTVFVEQEFVRGNKLWPRTNGKWS